MSTTGAEAVGGRVRAAGTTNRRATDPVLPQKTQRATILSVRRLQERKNHIVKNLNF